MKMKKLLFVPVFALLGCSDDSGETELGLLTPETATYLFGEMARMGWNMADEDISDVPADIVPDDFDPSNLPASVMFEDKFPPIVNQGDFNTCLAFAVGYNMKTALNAIDNGWSASDLANPVNQTSPKDFWQTIAFSQDGRNYDCNGGYFKGAFEALIEKGAKNNSLVPYSMSGTCNLTSNGDAGNRLATYRIGACNPNMNQRLEKECASNTHESNILTLKYFLAQKQPVAVGAEVNCTFKDWRGSSVMNYDRCSGGGGHAMVLSGYDDSRKAFRVRNSWGTGWGDNGSIWIDYEFFVKSMLWYSYIGYNSKSEDDPDSGYDLWARGVVDYQHPNSTDQRDRVFEYDVFNNGSLPVLASQRWSVVYMYFNPTNINDSGIIFEDYFTDEYGGPGEYGKISDDVWWNNIDVAPGKKVFEGIDNAISYTMPSITGNYYLAIIADANDAISEFDEENNVILSELLQFVNGVSTNTASSSLAAKKLGENAISFKHERKLNGYTPQEIKKVIKRNKKNSSFKGGSK